MRAPGFKLRRTDGVVDSRVDMDSNNVTTAETVLLRALVSVVHPSVVLGTQLLAVIQISVLGVTLVSVAVFKHG
jgi:hypothetical protein